MLSVLRTMGTNLRAQGIVAEAKLDDFLRQQTIINDSPRLRYSKYVPTRIKTALLSFNRFDFWTSSTLLTPHNQALNFANEFI